jgi:hypothetical protein
MVWHVVLLRPRRNLSDGERRTLIEAFQEALRAIPTIRRVHVMRRIRHGASYESMAPDAADFAVMLAFDDLRGLQAYLDHPAHEQLGTRFGETTGSAMVFDFEEVGLESV